MIDDALFAEMWVTSRHRGRGLAGRALSQELRRKGVDDDARPRGGRRPDRRAGAGDRPRPGEPAAARHARAGDRRPGPPAGRHARPQGLPGGRGVPGRPGGARRRGGDEGRRSREPASTTLTAALRGRGRPTCGGGAWQGGSPDPRSPRDRPTTPPRLHLGGRALSVVGRARVYVCGVTPYDVTHLGHAATFVWVDAADRLLRRLGVAVEVCRNVTDVDDVLFEAADRAGAHYDRFAAVQQFHFERDMDALGVRRPAHEPRAHTLRPAGRRARGRAGRGGRGVRGGRQRLPRRCPGRGARRPDARAALAPLRRRRRAGSTTRPSATRSTRRSGSAARRGSRPGRARGGRAGPVGTRSARRWPCRPTARGRPARRRRRPALPAPRVRGRAGRGGDRA